MNNPRTFGITNLRRRRADGTAFTTVPPELRKKRSRKKEKARRQANRKRLAA